MQNGCALCHGDVLQRSCWLLHPIQTQIVRLAQLEAALVEAAESDQHWTLRLGGRD